MKFDIFSNIILHFKVNVSAWVSEIAFFVIK